MKHTGVVAVTGAGTGLGSGIALEGLRRGYRVLALILEEQQRDGLLKAAEELPGALTVDVLDVTQIGDFAFPHDLEVLVNNAGIRLESLPIEEIPAEEWRQYMDVNFFGPVELARRAIPLMRDRGRGTICNINSITLAMAFPFLGAYRATKGALGAFSESLRVEVAPFGIRVIEVMPTAIRTNVHANSIVNHVAAAVNYEPYRPMAQQQRQQYLDNSDSTVVLDIETAATAVFDAIDGDGEKMRYGTDASSSEAIAAWRPGDR